MATSTPGRARRPDSAPATPVAGLAGLGNRFVELFGRKLSRRTLAVETARLIAEAVRVRAVAILGYDRRRDRLALLAEHGLPPEARVVLGGGADSTWDIPMRGLRNRRISVVEAAHQNPFVPPSLVALSPGGLCIASLPLYYDYEPVGVVLLFAAGSRGFPDAHLQTLSQALRVCARGLRDTSSPAARPARPELRDASAEAATRAAAAAEANREGAAAPTAQPTAAAAQAANAELVAKGQDLEDELRRTHEDVERKAQMARSLTASAHAAARERDGLVQQLADAERARDVEATELRAQVAALEERLFAVDSERARSQRVAEARNVSATQSIQKLESERAALTERVSAAESSATELQTHLTAERAERGRLATQVEQLTAQVRAGAETLQRAQARYAQERVTTEADRDAWMEQATALGGQLAARSDTLGSLDRELRGAVIGRDAATSQLQAARAEIDRLTALSEELSVRATQLEATHAAAAAEGTTLQRALEDERAARQHAEEALRTDLATVRQEAERVTAEVATLTAELAERRRAVVEREAQLAGARTQAEADRQAAAQSQQTLVALRAELATLTARFEQSDAERQQLSDERTALRATLSETRHRAGQADVAHAATLGQIQAETVELHRQVETLSVDRSAVTDRLQRAVEEGRDLTVRLAAAQRRSGELLEALGQRDAALEELTHARETLAVEAATSAGQLQAAQEAFERLRATAAHDRSVLAAERDEWKEQANAVRDELAHRAERLAAVEHDLRSTRVARDAATAELQTARAELDRLAALTDELRQGQTRLEAERAAGMAESTALRTALAEERATRTETERAHRADLAVARTEAERLAVALLTRQDEMAQSAGLLAERDTQLAAFRREAEALRQQSTDRGVLARQASELGSKVVELEQALAAAHGEAARTERQRAATEERLEASRRREAETVAAATQERGALQAALQRLTDERARAAVDDAALQSEIDGLRATLADVQATLAETRAGRAHAIEETRAATELYAGAQHRLEELADELRHREAAVAATTTENQRLAAQLAAATQRLQLGAEAMEAARAAGAEEREALAADRDAWQQRASTADAEIHRLTALTEQLQRQAADTDGKRSSATAELTSLRRAVEDERAGNRRAADALRAELANARTAVEQLNADAATLRAELADRDAQVEALRRREDAAQQAESAWQHERTALRAELAAVTAHLEDRTGECQQLREGRAALEHQLALVTATQGEAEQVLAQGLDAARAQIAQLEEVRTTLCATLNETRQRLGQAEASHAAALAERDSETGKFRRQLQSLTSARTKQTRRIEDAEHALAARAQQVEDERQRANGLAERSAQLEQSLAATEAQRTVLDADLMQAHTEVGVLVARLEESATTCQALRDERATLERDLALAVAGRDERQQALAQQLQAARQRAAELEQSHADLQSMLESTRARMAAADAAQGHALDQARAEAEMLRQQVDNLEASHDAVSERLQQTEQELCAQAERAEVAAQRATALAEQRQQVEQSLRAATERRAGLEAQLAQAQVEIEALRQQSDDRGVLAHQASELGGKVVELEQQLAAVRGEVARAERERAAVAEELSDAQRVHAETYAAAEQRHATLRETVERLTAKQHQLEAENAKHLADAEPLRAVSANDRAVMDQLRAERARSQEEGEDATRRVSELHQRLDELNGRLGQRDAAVEAANAERQRLGAQVAKLTSQLRATQETLESVQGRSALERAAAEAERDDWKARAAATRAEAEGLAARTAELTDTAAQLENAHSTLSAENATLRRALDEARATHREADAALRGDVAAVQAEVERLSADAVAQRSALAEREEQLTALRCEQDAARARDAEGQQTTAALRAEVATLTTLLQASGAESQQLRDRREALERQLALTAAARGHEEQVLQAAREQIAQLEQERTTLRGGLDAAHHQGTEVQKTQTASVEQLRADAAELRTQLSRVTAERTALSDRLLRTEQSAAAQAESAELDRQHVATLNGRCAQLEESLVAAESRRTGLDRELAKVRVEIEALQQQSADRGVLAHQSSELGSRVRELEQQLAAEHADRARIERQRAAMEEQLRTAHDHQEQAAAAAQREQAVLREALARLQEEHRQLEADRTDRANAAATLRTQVTELRSTVGEFTVQRERVQEETHNVAEHLSETQQRVAELSSLLQRRDTLIQTATAERDRFEEAARAAERTAAELATERDELRRTLTERTNQLEQERLAHTDEKAAQARDLAAQLEKQQRVAKAPEPAAVQPAPSDAAEETPPLYQGPLEIERSAPLGAVGEGAPEPLDAPPAEPARPLKLAVPSAELVLLDDGSLRKDACAALKRAGFEVSAFAPTEAGVDDMLRRKVKCVMLNLGGGVAAWHTLRVLRERVGSRNLPILAYIMTKDAPAGFCFGRADFALWPMDPARMVERLGRLRPKLKRLLALSADVDGMGRMRELLAPAKISTSIVLDGKQAVEFAAMVDPEAAVLHLSPTCPSVTRAVAGLRSTEATRDLPLMLLLDKTPAPREDAFFTAATVQLLSKPAFQFTNLPEEIARVIG